MALVHNCIDDQEVRIILGVYRVQEHRLEERIRSVAGALAFEEGRITRGDINLGLVQVEKDGDYYVRLRHQPGRIVASYTLEELRTDDDLRQKMDASVVGRKYQVGDEQVPYKDFIDKLRKHDVDVLRALVPAARKARERMAEELWGDYPIDQDKLQRAYQRKTGLTNWVNMLRRTVQPDKSVPAQCKRIPKPEKVFSDLRFETFKRELSIAFLDGLFTPKIEEFYREAVEEFVEVNPSSS